MLNAYERQLILFYPCNAASRFHYASPEARNLVDWVFENYDLLALEGESKELGEHRASRHNEKEMSSREWQRLRKSLENEYSAACGGTQEDCTTRRLRQLEWEIDLAPEDVAMLEIMLRSHMQSIIESLIDSVFECGRLHHRRRFFNVTSYLLPYVLGVPANSFHTRFTFKIALDYLTLDQSQAAFHTYFSLGPPPEIGDLTILTPGDFAVVRRKAEILGLLQDAKALAELLRTECEAKPNHSRKMGF